MCEGGHRVPGAEGREEAALVQMEQADLPCQGGEPDCEDAFEDLRNAVEKDDYSEEGWVLVG